MLDNLLLLSTKLLPILVYEIKSLKILDINESAIEQYGYTHDEFLKLTIKDIRPPSEWLKVEERISLLQSTKKIIHNQPIVHQKKNGDTMLVEISSQPIMYQDKECRLVACNIVTEKYKIIEEYKANEKKLIKAQKIGKLGYWEVNKQLDQLYCSDAIFEIWGVNRATFKLDYDNFLTTIHEQDREPLKAQLQKFLEGKGDLDMNVRIILPDRTIKWVHEKGNIIRTATGEIKCFEGTVQDITDRIKMEQSLIESQKKYEYISKASSNAIWDWDLETNKLQWGDGFLYLFGYPLEELTDDISSWIDHLHPDDVDRVIKGIKKVIDSDNNKWSDEYRYQKKDGSYVFVSDRGYVIRNDEGAPVRMVGAMQDINDRKNFEKQLTQLNESLQNQARELRNINEELEQFAYVASHDLQEPLRMVKSFMSLLEEKYNSIWDEKAKKYIHFAVDGANRMEVLIKDLLKYSTSGTEHDHEIVDLNKVLEEVKELFKSVIEEKEAIIKSSKLPELNVSHAGIRQVMQNLIGNGLKYQHPRSRPQISIEAVEQNNHWKFSFKDNGIGISEKYYNKIFNLFSRLHAKSDYSGTGIGLTICKKIISKMNGQIWVESKEGEGSIFYCTIPKT